MNEPDPLAAESSAPPSQLLVCRECDALMSIVQADPGAATCFRCGSVVRRRTPGGDSPALALFSGAALLLLMANVLPVVSIEAAGNRVGIGLTGAARALGAQQMRAVGLLVFTTTVVIPAVDILCTLGAIALARMRRGFGVMAVFCRARALLRPWSMVEIFMLGALVAIVKLSSLASVVVEPGFWSLAGFVLLSAAAAHEFDPAALWRFTKARA